MGGKAKDIADCQRLLLSDAAVGQPPKGKGKGVPQVGDADGPKFVESGWRKGYKLWVGDLPKSIDNVEICKVWTGFIDVSVNNTKTNSGHAFAVISFEDLTLAMEAFDRMQWTKFDHAAGQLHWPLCEVVWPSQARVSAGPCTVALIGCAMCELGVPCCTHLQCV